MGRDFLSLPIEDLLDQFARETRVPGAGPAAALTTAATLRLMSSSALTRSRSEWSMMAISPGPRRLVMFFVR